MIVIINNRNRLTWPRAMVTEIRRLGGFPVILDNASTYPPLLDWYGLAPHYRTGERKACVLLSPHRESRILLSENLGPYAPWYCKAGGLSVVADLTALSSTGQRYCVTDPDLNLSTLPDDALRVMAETLDKYPQAPKVGLGLLWEDIPDHYPLKALVQGIERAYWTKEITPGVFDAPTDTTFAMYRERAFSMVGVRLGGAYAVRHLPWYADPKNLSEEEAYYAAHADLPRSNVSPSP